MRMLFTIFWTITALVFGYLLLIVLIYFLQGYLIYHPTTNLSYTPKTVGLKYEDLFFTSEDGVKLHGWFIPHKNPRGTVLFQHGNAGNISGRVETIKMLNQIGLNVFIYDYRGYGQSKGAPSEEGTYNDCMAAWKYLVENRTIEPGSIVLMGRSLGGGVTAWLATQVEPAGVILESTFTSAVDLGADLYPIFPVRQLMRYEYPNLQRVKNIRVPILVAHSTEDDLIPFEHGRQLYEAANEPKEFFEMKGDHGNGFLETGKSYISMLDSFATRALGEKKITK